MEQSERKKNLIIYAIFGMFFCFLMLQYKNIYFYSDDYGYASLSYAVVSKKEGIWEFFDYLRLHYLKWGGRVLYYSVLVLGLQGGPIFMRILESVILLVDFVLLYNLISKDGKAPKVLYALSVCLLYGIFEIGVASQSLYWFSAAITYTLPMCTYLLFIKLIFNEEKMQGTCYNVRLIAIVAFLLGFSQEQYAATACVITVGLIIYKVYKKESVKNLLMIFGALLVGALLLLLAPGNFNRDTHAETGAQTGVFLYIERMNNMLSMLFSELYQIFILCISICLIISCLFLIIKYQKKWNIIPLLFEIAVIIGQVYYGGSVGNVANMVFVNRTWAILVEWIYCILLCVVIAQYAYFMKKKYVFICSCSGILSICAMCVTTEISYRCFVPLMLFMIVYIADVICELVNVKKGEILYIGTSIFMNWVLLGNILGIYAGYQTNYEVNKYNWETLSLAGESGMSEGMLLLYMNENDTYSYVVPYMYDFSFVGEEKAMKRYFGIENDVEFVWIRKENN